MKRITKILSGSLLVALMAVGLVTKADVKHDDHHLEVRDVLTEEVTKDVTGKVVRKADGEAPEAKNLISEIKAQVSADRNEKTSIRFVVGIDSYLYESAKFNIVAKNGEEVYKDFGDHEISYVYTHVVANGVTLSTAEAFGEGYNYMMAFTVNNVPYTAWDYTFEVTASVKLTADAAWTSSSVAEKTINNLIMADENTYYVYDTAGLKTVADNVNLYGETYKNKTIKLMNNIDLNNELWTPIGLTGDNTGFAGTFDGNDKTISNLKIDLTAEPKYQSAGLFGSANGGTIKNFKIVNAEVNSVTTGADTSCGTAVVVGSSQNGVTIENVDVENAKVTGNRYVSVIAGYFAGTITDCDVVDATLVAAPDNFTGSYDNGDKVGTIIGYSNGATKIDGNTVTDVEITAYRDMGGIGGAVRKDIITNNTVENLILNVDQVTGNMGTRTPTADVFVGRDDSNSTIGTGNTSKNITKNVITPDNTVFIDTVEDLKALAETVNAGTTYKGYSIILNNDLDLNNEEWTPIGNSTNNFQGYFYGGNHTISNLSINQPDSSYVGLFGYTTDGRVSDLVINNASIVGRLGVGVVAGSPYTSDYNNISLTGLIKVDAKFYAGGAFGYNLYGNATNIVIDADKGSYVKANSIENGSNYRCYVGGVVGFMGEGSQMVKNVTSNIDVYGTVVDVGGIAGIAHYGNSFINCVSTGNVTIEHAELGVDGYLEVGGIAGVWHNASSSVTFTSCKFNGTISATLEDGTIYEGEFANNGIVGPSYNATGAGVLVIDGNSLKTVSDATELATAIENVEENTTLKLTAASYDLAGATLALPDGVTLLGSGDTEVSNVTFTVANEQEAKFENVSFAGTTSVQAIEDGTLNFINCEFNIAPNKLNGNGRAAAIIGSHQDATVDLVLDGCVFNYQSAGADTYNAAIFMWSSVNNVLIKNCEFNDYGFVAVKLMNVASGANIVFENNTFNMSAEGSSNFWYNCAIQIVPQNDNKFSVSFINNEFNGDYQKGKDLISEFGFSSDNENSIVVEIAGMNYGFALTNVTFAQSGNKINGVTATLDNFARKFA